MGKPDVPEGPDYDKLLKLSEENMSWNQSFSEDFMAWNKDVTERQMERADEIYELQLPGVTDSLDLAQTQRDRYRSEGIPLEDKFVKELVDWSTPERQAAEAAGAIQDVDSALHAEKEATLAKMASYGVDPSQVRSTGLDTRMGVAGAAAKAKAGTDARRTAELQGVANLGTAANVYKGLPEVAVQNMTAASNVSQQGLGGTQNAGALGQSGGQIGSSMIGQNQDILNSGYSTANDIYGNQLQGWQMEAQNSPLAIGSELLGTTIGAGFNPLSFFEDGGVVTPEMSPSGGGIPDDVNARLTAGEVVIPREAVMYHGIKNIAKLVDDARINLGIMEDPKVTKQKQKEGIPT